MPKLKQDIKNALKDKFAGVDISDSQIDLLESAEKFCRKTSPIELVRDLIEIERGFDTKTWEEIVSLGWTAIAIPESYDGIGLRLGDVVPVMEMMGRALFHTPFLATTLAAQAIVAGGSEDQKSEILPQLASGKIATLALSEPGGDFDLNNIQMTAEKTANGFRLSGTKSLVLNASVADYFILSAMLDGVARLFLVSAAQIPEHALRRETLIDQTKRGYALDLNGIEISEGALMPQDKTQAALQHIQDCGALLYAAEMVGGTKACIDYTVEYLKTRKQFGRLIGSYQALKHPIVDAFVDYEKSRSLLYAAASNIGQGARGRAAVAMAKIKSEQAFSYASDRAIQFHGGFGFTYDCDAQLYRRRAIFDAAQFGDARFHKAELARMLYQ